MLLNRSLALPSLLLLLLASDCHGNSSGAPTQACANLTPGHGPSPQPKAEFPYRLEVTPASVQPGGSVTLTISSLTSGTQPIKGFFVQARTAPGFDSSAALGQFIEIDSLHKAVNCNNSPASGITHSSPESKQHVSVTWQAPDAPDEPDSDVVFLVTVVQEFDTFWVGMQSEHITLTHGDEPAAEPKPEPTEEPEPAAEPEPKEMDGDADDDDKKGSAGSVRAGAALLLAPLAMAAFLRLQ